MCACLKALCTEEQIRELSKLLDLGEQSFDSFSLDYYSPLPWPGESLSPRENMEFIFDVCSSYARKFGRFYFRNLFLTGARAGQDLPICLHRPHCVGERTFGGV